MIKLRPYNIIFIIFYSILNALSTVGVLYIINLRIKNVESISVNVQGILFFAFILSSYLINYFFQKEVISFCYKLVYDNELLLSKKIINLSYQKSETIGLERIHGILDDIRHFIYLASVIVNTLNAVIMIILCIVYLYLLSVFGATATLILISFMIYFYFIKNNKLSQKLHHLKQHNDSYNKFFEDIITGFKELKISAVRCTNLFQKFLLKNRNEARDLDISLSTSFSVVTLLNQHGLYFLFGFIFFVFPFFKTTLGIISPTFIVVLLFMTTPINKIITMQNFYVRFHVSLKRIRDFYKEIDQSIIQQDFNQTAPNENFEVLEFINCYFEQNEGFKLGPFDFKISKGEVVFIIGGNGSGKTTFIKVLTGLYPLSSGTVLLNGKHIQNSSPDYQNYISAVFTDNHIFSNNYNNYSLKDNIEYLELLKTFRMNLEIVDANEGSTRRKFSKGQSKRISMMLALLEKKPLLVLDEWAADQDPHSRKLFYKEILPDLKNSGKTIIAVTHDEAYFDCADRIIRFEYGNIIKEITNYRDSTDPITLWQN